MHAAAHGGSSRAPSTQCGRGSSRPCLSKLPRLIQAAHARAEPPPTAHGAVPGRGGDHKRAGEPCSSPLASKPTAPSAPASCATISSTLRGSAARALDAQPMMLGPAAHTQRRMTVRAGGSVGVKEGAHLRSGRSKPTKVRRSVLRRRPRGCTVVHFQWTAAGRRRAVVRPPTCNPDHRPAIAAIDTGP